MVAVYGLLTSCTVLSLRKGRRVRAPFSCVNKAASWNSMCWLHCLHSLASITYLKSSPRKKYWKISMDLKQTHGTRAGYFYLKSLHLHLAPPGAHPENLPVFPSAQDVCTKLPLPTRVLGHPWTKVKPAIPCRLVERATCRPKMKNSILGPWKINFWILQQYLLPYQKPMILTLTGGCILTIHVMTAHLQVPISKMQNLKF